MKLNRKLSILVCLVILFGYVACTGFSEIRRGNTGIKIESSKTKAEKVDEKSKKKN